MKSEIQKQDGAQEAGRSSLHEVLCVNEQQVILDRARHKMRDLECQYRKDADSWHKQGAKAQAQLCAYMADAIDQAIRELLKAETEYRNAKHATYA
jgi:hypothetical protein